MKEEAEHGSVRGNNFGSKRSAIKLDKIFMREEEIREKKGLAFTRARGGMEVRKEMGMTYREEGRVDGEGRRGRRDGAPLVTGGHSETKGVPTGAVSRMSIE